jgi:hypothetical protein
LKHLASMSQEYVAHLCFLDAWPWLKFEV